MTTEAMASLTRRHELDAVLHLAMAQQQALIELYLHATDQMTAALPFLVRAADDAAALQDMWQMDQAVRLGAVLREQQAWFAEAISMVVTAAMLRSMTPRWWPTTNSALQRRVVFLWTRAIP